MSKKSTELDDDKIVTKKTKKSVSEATDISPKNNKKETVTKNKVSDSKIDASSLSRLEENDLDKETEKLSKKSKEKPKKKIKIDSDLNLPEGLEVVDLNEATEPITMQKEVVKLDPQELAENEPEIISILKLKKKKRKEVKFEKKRLKKQGRTVTRKHLKRLRKGLEVPRYKTKFDYGLSETAVSRRINEGLINDKVATTSKTYKRIFFANIVTFFNFLTISIAIWLISVGAWTDLIFLMIVTANMVIGIYQEVKAKRTIDRLSILSAPTATVLRSGEVKELAVNKIVLDDLMLLETGKQIVTDSIVVDGIMEVNESLLTGESDAIVKKPGDFIYAGSFVVSGRAKAQVEKIGKDNFIETLTSQAKKHKKPKSELLNALNTIIRVMSIVIVILGAILFWMQHFVNGVEMERAVRATAGAMIGMIPAGLFLTTSIALFVGVVKLAEHNVLVRELYCIEMLARINVLCLDKTGTITDGTMNVKNVVEYSTVAGLSTKYIVSAMLNALNDKNLTSVALEEKFGLGKRIKHDDIVPFSSSRKYSAVDFGRYGTFILGAPDIIMKHKYSLLEKEVTKYSKEGYRVILLAHTSEKIVDQEIDLKTCQQVSLILIEDNIRPDAIQTIEYFKNSGVEVKVISGDNPLTVSMIGQRAGILNAEQCISLDGLTDEEVIAAADKYTVFGRVSPGQKQLLVKTLKKLDKIVAMTGDGVNDILALKEADCSIAVASGSEAARSVSHLVLLDSNFGSMPKVVSEGRRVINNVAKVASLFLTKTIFSLLLAIQAIQSGGVYPITTIQLLMIDLLVIGIPSMILILEPNNAKSAGNFLFRIIKGALPGAVAILLISLVVFGLQDTMQLSFMETSTIIVIAATFTGMMVLFEICKPLNTLRRGLCAAMFSVFVFVTLLFPQMFEFSPLFPFAQYHSDTIELNSITSAPNVGVTPHHHLIIDGKLFGSHDPQLNLANRTAQRVDPNQPGSYYLRIDGTSFPSYRFELPTFFTNTIDGGYLVFDSLMTNNNHSPNIESIVRVRENGDVVIVQLDDQGKEIEDSVYNTGFNLMPRVGVANNASRNLIINGNRTNISGFDRIETLAIRFNEYSKSYVLYVNNEMVTSQTFQNGFVIPTPALSLYNGYYAIAGRVSNITTEYSDITTNDLELNTSGHIIVEGVPTNVTLLPTVDTTGTNDYWIINDVVTWYHVEGRRISFTLGFTERTPVELPDGRGYFTGYLVINGVQTHFEVEVFREIGGPVPVLPLEAVILLLLLCATSAPLIKILKAVVPWGKKHFDNISNLISNM